MVTPGQTAVPQQRTTNPEKTTVVDLSFQDLRNRYGAELHDLEFDENQQDLGLLLKKAGENVEAFFKNIHDTSSKEQIIMQRLREDGKVEASLKASFDYLLLSRPDPTGTSIEEYRTDSQGKSVKLRTDSKALPAKLDKTSGYMVTSGFAGHCIFLHPSHRFGSRFRYLGKQASAPHAQVIAFAQRPEAGDFLAAIGSNNLTPVLLQGLVWVDPQTYQIVRLRTDLLEPPSRYGVTRQTTEVRFSEVHLQGIPEVFWLPREVVVTVERYSVASVKNRPILTAYRNTHTYSGYKLFTVESRIHYDKVVTPPVKK